MHNTKNILFSKPLTSTIAAFAPAPAPGPAPVLVTAPAPAQTPVRAPALVAAPEIPAPKLDLATTTRKRKSYSAAGDLHVELLLQEKDDKIRRLENAAKQLQSQLKRALSDKKICAMCDSTIVFNKGM
jgi:hypothetical protein